MNVDEQQTTLTYKFKRPDGVLVTTALAGGKAHIMEERGEGSDSKLTMLERSQLTAAETALFKEVSAIG